DGNGNLTGITRLDNTRLTFAYDADGRLTREDTPTTGATFVYDGNGMLSSIDGGLGDTITVAPVLSHGFASPAANLQDGVAVVTDALSHPTTIMLDSSGKPAQLQRADGSIEGFVYDSN